ncbi:pyridoxamine 5'-phosphate oxidase family protein [Streptomyces sp. NPDC046261]|uniref:pyridoxamine 5'-phosphate oxidase family protein n=1 Tax=Streptomyces sp. NPDC046261 TaxID=3157200 RepID=UPI0033FFE6DB
MTFDWADFQAAEPAFAKALQNRFQAYRHHVLATLRKDGSPRLTGLEVDFRHGHLWLGMMPNSRKAHDIRRDARFALHANPGPDSAAASGDARLCGHAIEVTDPLTIARYAEEVAPPEPFHLFKTQLTEAVLTRVEGSDLVVRVWRPGSPVRTLRRGNDAGPPREDR